MNPLTSLDTDPRRLREKHVVVCVDDEPPILGALNRLLRNEPYDLVTTVKPGEALDRIDLGGDRKSVV